MRRKVAVVVGAVVLLSVGAGALALAEGGFPGEKREVAERVAVERVMASERGPVVRSGRRGPKITFFFSPTPLVPAEGGGRLVKVRCPDGEGVAIDGGARTSQGIVLGYLSKASPEGRSSEKSFYVGIDDNSSMNSDQAGAFVEVQCAKGIRAG